MKICEYKNSYLYYSYDQKFSFEGELEEVAIAIYKEFGIECQNWNPWYIANGRKSIRGTRLYIQNVDGGQQLLFDDKIAGIGDLKPEKPLFFDLLNEKYIVVYKKYESMEIFS